MVRARPTLSVVVPTWNEEACLPRLLASLGLRPDGSRSDDAPEELLVADGGSSDGTRAVAESHGALWLETPRGRGTQMAHAAERVQGDVLLFLHADVRLAPGVLDVVRRAYGSSGERERVASGMRQTIEHSGRIYRAIERAADWRVRRGWVYGDSGLVVRRSTYEAVGGFRELPVFEDLDLSRRLQRAGRVDLLTDARLFVSPRRWQREGPVRRSLKNWVLTLAWASGVDPRRLARYYLPSPDPARET